MTLTLKIVTFELCTAIRPMMMHCHAMLGYKRFSGSEVIVHTFTAIWNLCLDREHGNPVFSLDTLAYRESPSN